MKVRMKKAGKWADPQPSLPQIEVQAGEEVEVSAALGEIMVNAGAAEIVKPAKQVQKKATRNPAKQDKEKAEG